MNFPFMEEAELCDTKIQDQTIVAVDLGINTTATVSVMLANGTILGRHFCKLSGRNRPFDAQHQPDQKGPADMGTGRHPTYGQKQKESTTTSLLRRRSCSSSIPLSYTMQTRSYLNT
ncbi:MAG: hypothetical protein ACLTX3_07580 [Lachnospiraceae bacterium]